MAAAVPYSWTGCHVGGHIGGAWDRTTYSDPGTVLAPAPPFIAGGLNQKNVDALIAQIGGHWLVEAGDVFLVPSPIAHIGGSIYAFECPLLLGTTAVLMERWDPAEAVALEQVPQAGLDPSAALEVRHAWRTLPPPAPGGPATGTTPLACALPQGLAR